MDLCNLETASTLLKRVNFTIFRHQFEVSVNYDKKYGQRLYLQVAYLDTCRISGKLQEWKGRKWYLSSHMTPDEVIKTAFAACKATVEHEVMEGFTVDGKVLFNPHVSFEELISISHKEVKRDD